MRKIRSRGIAYGVKAIDVIAQQDHNRIESISHTSQNAVQKRSTRLEMDQRDLPMQVDDGGGDKKKERETQQFGSVVSACLCYLRSIPVQPSLDLFHKNNEKAPNIKQVFDSSVFMKAEICSNDRTKIDKLSNIQLIPEYLLNCSANLESLRQFYGVNVIINISTLNTIENYHYLPSTIPYEPDLPKLKVDKYDDVGFLRKNYTFSSKITPLVETKTRLRGRPQNSDEDIDPKMVQAIETKVNTSHISDVYFNTFDQGNSVQTKIMHNRNVQSWLEERKRRWNKDAFYRNSKRIVGIQSLFFVKEILDDPSLLTRDDTSFKTNRKNYHISHDCNVDFINRTAGNIKNQSFKLASTGVNFASKITFHIKSIRFTRKGASLCKKYLFKQNVHLYCRESTLLGNKSKDLLHCQSNSIYIIEKTPSRITKDPRLPKGTNIQEAQIQPRAISSYNSISTVIFTKIQMRRRLIEKKKRHSSCSDVFHYRTISKMMSPYNLLGGTFIPHIKKVKPSFIFQRQTYDKLFQVDHFSGEVTRLFQNSKFCAKNMRHWHLPFIRQNTQRPLLIPIKHRGVSLQNTFDESLFIHASHYVGKECISNHKTEICYFYGLREEQATQLLTSFEAIQSISVEVRGELIHLLHKIKEFGNQIIKKNTQQEESLKLGITADISDVEGSKAKQKVKRKRKKELSQSSSTDKKRRKKKSKEKKKKHFNRKRKGAIELVREKVKVIKVPSLHVGSTPVIITHEKYKVTSIQQNLNRSICHQQMYERDITMKNVTKHIEQVPQIDFPSFPLGVTPVSVFSKSRALVQIDHQKKLDEGVGKKLSSQTTPQSAIKAGDSSKNNKNQSKGQDVQLPIEDITGFENRFEKKIETEEFEIMSDNQGMPFGHSVVGYKHIDHNQHDNIITEMVEPSPVTMLPASQLVSAKKTMKTDEEILSLLCSENFLETWSQAASELSSGKWVNYAHMENLTEVNYRTLMNKKICLHDCILVDECWVDVELPNYSSIKIISLASWSNQSKTTNPKGFIKKFVQLVASDRYKRIHLIFVIDSAKLNEHVIEIVNLQNAIVKQQGCPCDCLCIQYIQASLLSTTIAMIASKNLINQSLNGSLFEGNILEQARFLLSVVPTLTVFDCLRFFCHNTKVVLKDEMVNISKSNYGTNTRTRSVQQLNIALDTILQNYPLN